MTLGLSFSVLRMTPSFTTQSLGQALAMSYFQNDWARLKREVFMSPIL
jgi:hypothetical protein